MDPIFWLKKWTKNGLTKTDRVDWIRILASAKNTKQEEDVLKFIKRVIQRGHFVSVPCYMDEKLLERFSNLPMNPIPDVMLAMDNEEHGTIQLLAPLIKSQNELNRDGFTPIYWASRNGSKDIVRILAPLMVKPLTPIYDGRTPIHAAARDGYLEIVKFLASLTDNPNAQDNYGCSLYSNLGCGFERTCGNHENFG